MYKIQLTGKAKKELKTIKLRYQTAIFLALEEIKEDPFLGKPLIRELTGKFSFRVGVYRIIYTINKKDKIVIVLNAGHRSIIYQ